MSRRVRRPAGLAAATLAAVLACGLGSPSPHLFTASFGDGGRLAVGAAQAQGADTILENVTLTLGPQTYRLPRIEFVGANLSRAELASLFDSRAGEPMGGALARLSAREARVPEVRIEETRAGTRQTTVYREVLARDIAAGRIAFLTSAGASLEATGQRAAQGTLGRMTVEGLDLGHLAALFTQKAGPGEAQMRTVYESFSLDGLQVRDAKGTDLRIARLSGRDLRARPTAESWGETIRLISEAQELEKAPPTERARLLGLLSDLLGAYEIGAIETSGIELRAGPQPATGRIARIAFTGAQGGRPAEARAEGIGLTGEGLETRIETVTFGGFSLGESLAGLKRLAEKPRAEIGAADLRSLMPTLGNLRVSGVVIEPTGGAGGEARRYGVEAIEVNAGTPINGIPSSLRIAVDHATGPVPSDVKDERLRDLAAMGYRRFDLSVVLATSWNEPGRELLVREISLQGADMGSLVLRGALANVGKDVFDPDSAVALTALAGATARAIDLTVENRGLLDRFIAQEARKQKKSPEDLRREYGTTAALAIPAVLGNSPAAKGLGQALARFVAKPGRLALSLRAKDPAGLGLTDVLASAEPAAILDKLEIAATAE